MDKAIDKLNWWSWFFIGGAIVSVLFPDKEIVTALFILISCIYDTGATVIKAIKQKEQGE